MRRRTLPPRLAVSAILLAVLALATPSSALAATQTWDLAGDFARFPRQANPSPDRYGNPGVWHYLRSAAFGRDSATYRPLGDYGDKENACATPACGSRDTASGWLTANGPYKTPFVLRRATDGQIVVHPDRAGDWSASGDADVVVGWRSPISGTVSIAGGVRDGQT